MSDNLPVPFVNQVTLGRALGVSQGTISIWTAEGKITPEIKEGRTARYDIAKVKAELAARVKKGQSKTSN